MRRKPTTLTIGSVSSGTLREQDLVPAFLDAADGLRLTAVERANLREIAKRCDAADDDDDPYWQEEAGYDLEELDETLNNHCPDYCYFGTHMGDGADFGCWPVDELFNDTTQGSYDGCVYRLPEGEYPNGSIPVDYSHALSVNDHGNATLYRRTGRRWIEVWAIV